MKKIIFIVFSLCSIPLFSHGAVYSILSDKVIKIEARFDTGEAFSNSEVLVFPPNQSEVAYTLETDDEGVFYFSPTITGTWILQVRGFAGHGLRINLPVDDNGITDLSGSGGLTLLQKILMVLSVGWGAIGTALYFHKSKK